MASKAKQFDALWSGILDDEGLPVALGKVYTYIAGSSSTAKATYTDRDKNTTAANPIILDAYGRAEVYGDGLYNIIVKDANDTTLWDMDNVEIIAQSANLILDGDELTSQSVNGNIDIQPTGTGVIRVGGTNNGSGDAQITTIQTNKDIDIAPNGTGKTYFNKNDAGSTGINVVLDEDNFASDRADALATQQSTKAYIASQVSATSGKQNINSGYFPSDGLEFKVSIQSPVAMAVDINASGYTWYNSTNNAVYNVTSNPTLTITAADATNPRWDIIQINANTQSISVKAGTAAAVPTKPTADSGYDIIAYIWVGAAVTTIAIQSYIQNIASAVNIKVGDNHFKTNFSINQKEDTEDSEYETQQYFQQLNYGTTFDYVKPDKTFLHTVDTFAVRADCDEITYTGSWSNDDSSNYRFGRCKASSSSGATAIFSFFGTSVGISLYGGTAEGPISFELSSDGGATYFRKITINHDTGSITYNNFYDLYTGLPIGEYKVKLTLLNTRVLIDHFYYTTYCIQRPCSIFALKTGSGGTAASISEVPPATSLLTGTWGTAKNASANSAMWDATYTQTATTGDYIEFKFYGSKIWVSLYCGTDGDADIDFTIDGATTYVRNTGGFNPDSPNNSVCLWYRIDNGSLSEGWHTVKVTATSITAANYFAYNGFSFYSANAPSTICRSLILGKSSYAIGADNSNLSYSGTWVGLADATGDFLRRRNSTVTNNSYVSFTVPANIKAIYLIAAVNNSTAATEIKITLGGSKTRYIDLQANNYFLPAFTIPIYDSFADGDISSQEIRVYHNGTTTTEQFIFNGFVFEIGDQVEVGYLMAMPKWTRYNYSTSGVESIVSNTYRLDVYGVKSDQSPGRLPQIHSGWTYMAWNSNGFVRMGVIASQVLNAFISTGSQPIVNRSTTFDMQDGAYTLGPIEYSPGIWLKNNGSTAASAWHKFWFNLKEVV